PIWRFREPAIEPFEPLRAEPAAAFAGDQRVEGDETDGMMLDRILQEAAPRQQALVGEGVAHRVALVMIAGDDIDRTGERRQQLAEQIIFIGPPEIAEIAG